jgi:hypothetical protein
MNPDKPFALFAGPTYYPAPGWQDHQGQYASVDEARENGEKIARDEYGWWQVVDLRHLKIVAGEGSGHSGLMGQIQANPNT